MANNLMLMGAGASGSGSIRLLYDTFTDTNGTNLTAHTMETGPGWTVPTGAFQIQNNATKLTAEDTTSIAQATAGASGADVTVTGSMNSGANAYSAMGVMFRYSDTNNFWLVQIVNSGGFDGVKLYDCVAGAFTERGSYAAAIALNEDHTLQVVLSGTGISVKLDGTERITFSSSFNQSATRHGLRFYGDGVNLNGATATTFEATAP